MANMQRILPVQGIPNPIVAAVRNNTFGTPNPMVNIASNIRNSLFGRGSLSSGGAHIGSIQTNINRALNASKQFSNAPAQTALQAAQKSIAAGDLAGAQKSLIEANNAMASLGYGKSISQPLRDPNRTNRNILR
ncbi:MAG: hypothetical protein ACYDEF_09410 [Methanosarcina sp.]